MAQHRTTKDNIESYYSIVRHSTIFHNITGTRDTPSRDEHNVAEGDKKKNN